MGTLNRILQAAAQNNEDNIDEIDEDEEEIEYDDSVVGEDISSSGGTTKAEEGVAKRVRSKGPRLDRLMEDDDFVPELRLKNEHLLK
jgi:hypothetical protein